MRHTSWTGPGLSAVLCSVVLSGCGDQSPSDPTAIPAASNPAAIAPTYAAAKGPNGESRYLVQFKESEGADFEAKVKALGGKVARRNKEIASVLVTGLSASALGTLRARADVEEMGSDLRAQFIPPRQQLVKSLVRIPAAASRAKRQNDQSDAFFFADFQWNMRKIRAPEAWRNTRAGKGVEVCMLDTGVDPNHIDLAGKVDLGVSTSFVASEPFIDDLNFHGTYTSSIVATNGLGVASVAPAATICTIKVLDQSGSGDFADVLAGIVYAGVLRADVMNMSLGALLDLSDPDQRSLANALQKAVNFAHRQGVLVVASSGNNALNLDQTGRIKSIPAQLDNVISVGATGPINQKKFDRLASYSNYGRSDN
ncbi:MAG: S8 family serine peptidase, partial [Gemmatimonadales bacterium]